MFQAIESLETRQLLCAVPHPAGFEPARLTPGMDKFAEGMSVTVQQLTHPTAAAGNGKLAQPENPTYTPDAGTPNLAVLDVFMSDVSGNEVATPAVGSYAYMQVEYSTVNYKDGLAIVNGAPVVRTWPLVPGIDFVGVQEGTDKRVVLNGWGVGESRWGGFAQKARVPSEWLVELPASIDPPAMPSAPSAVPEALSVTKPPAPMFANWIDSPSTET